MKYLLTVQTVAHVDIRWLLGYAEDKLQIYSLICNFYKYCQHCAQHKENAIEDQLTQFDITIYQVSELNWDKLHFILDQYEDELVELHYKYKEIWQLEDNLFNNFFIYFTIFVGIRGRRRWSRYIKFRKYFPNRGYS